MVLGKKKKKKNLENAEVQPFYSSRLSPVTSVRIDSLLPGTELRILTLGPSPIFEDEIPEN